MTMFTGPFLRVRGLLPAAAVPVDADEVLTLIDTARAESVGKAVLVTLGRFSDEAREAARGNPVDLVDGDQLADLVKKHLPQAWATRSL
jgi:restriction endonuclease Mrr